MNSFEPASYSATREYKRNSGFLLANDVGHAALADILDNMPITRIDRFHEGSMKRAYTTLKSPTATLCLVANDLRSNVREYLNPASMEFDTKFSVLPADRKDNYFEYADGLVEQEFAWNFASVVASEVVESFRDQGFLTLGQQADMTLLDYSNIIRTEWFSKLIHDMALAANGAYGTFGVSPYDFAPGQLREHVMKQLSIDKDESFNEEKLFDVVNGYDSEGNTEIRASLSERFRKMMRIDMKRNNSAGCPVARYRGVLPTSLVQVDVHAHRMETDGVMQFAVSDDPEKVKFSQSKTPIDIALFTIAEQLEAYFYKYGMPRIRMEDGDIFLDHVKDGMVYTPPIRNLNRSVF